MTERNLHLIPFRRLKDALIRSVLLLTFCSFAVSQSFGTEPERAFTQKRSDNLNAKISNVSVTSGPATQQKSVVTIVYFKDANDFAKTYDKADTVKASIRALAFSLYKRGSWFSLETLFKRLQLNKSGTTIWPPANGGYNIVDSVPIKAGQKYDRYGNAAGYTGTGIPNLTGNFTSPMPGGISYKFTERALNLPESGYDFYYVIEVLKDLPFKSQTADIIPWFGQQGNGKQSMWFIPKNPNSPQGYNYTFTDLAQLGYIKITIVKSPSGKYPQLAGTVIQKQ